MQYVISFIEGIITFISPCLLPMLPIYISYFAGGGERSLKRTVTTALGFVLGFTLVFVVLGALAGSLGGLLKRYQTEVNLVSGLLVIFLGLNFLGVFRLNLFQGRIGRIKHENMGFFSAALFGIIFSISWTPCVGTFLGATLMLVAQQGHVTEGVLMLLAYSVGLGVPFLISAVLVDYLKSAFGFIKAHYRIVNGISGGFLILVGILMATGTLGRLFALISY